MNDRALRHIVIGLGGHSQGVPRESGFDITAASEVMAILCMADSPADLRSRLDRILVGYSAAGEPVLAKSIGVTGAMTAILNEATMPNLVQTAESTPAFVHGGPFANIAHGCNSILATRMALAMADYAVTEAGFAFDLGGEKFFDLKCRAGGFNPAAIVLVATVRALKMHGGVRQDALKASDPAPSSEDSTTWPLTLTAPPILASRLSWRSTSLGPTRPTRSRSYTATAPCAASRVPRPTSSAPAEREPAIWPR